MVRPFEFEQVGGRCKLIMEPLAKRILSEDERHDALKTQKLRSSSVPSQTDCKWPSFCAIRVYSNWKAKASPNKRLQQTGCFEKLKRRRKNRRSEHICKCFEIRKKTQTIFWISLLQPVALVSLFFQFVVWSTHILRSLWRFTLKAAKTIFNLPAIKSQSESQSCRAVPQNKIQ